MHEIGLRKFIRRTQRFAGKVAVKGRNVANMLAKPDQTELALQRLRAMAGPSPELRDKVVVITGSTRGLGLAVARGFAAEGARVVVNGRSDAAVAAVVAELVGEGAAAAGVAADVSTPAGAAHLLAKSLEAFGRLDILINNAGVFGTPGKRIWDYAPDQQADVIRTNLMGPMICASIAIDWMIKHTVSGRIINVSSGAGESAAPTMGPYGISKFGIEGLTKYLAADLDQCGITAVTVQPGSLRTDMTLAAFGWAQAQAFPDPEAAVQSFIYAATAPAQMVHGRVISVGRHAADPFAEGRLSSPVAAASAMSFRPLEFDGKIIDRQSPEFAVFDRAESQFAAAPEVRSTVRDFAKRSPIHMYPDPSYGRLRALLAAEHGLPEECFEIGNGSSELISRIIQLFVKPGETAISNGPGWFGFEVLSRRIGVNGIHVPFALNGQANRAHHNLDAIADRIDASTRLIYLISPSNPEGVPLRTEAFRAFLDRVPPHLPIIVDEAYYEYAADPEIVTTTELVMQSDRTLIGLRTFSKFFGLAGMRVGYAFARPEIIGLISRLGMAFNIAAVAEDAAVAALSAKDFRQQVHGEVVKQRTWLEGQFAELGLDYVPSQSGMILVERPRGDLLEMYRRFEREGIFLSRGTFFDDKYMLFPVGTEEQNRRNVAILRSLV